MKQYTLLLAVLALGVSACGGSPTGPTPPTTIGGGAPPPPPANSISMITVENGIPSGSSVEGAQANIGDGHTYTVTNGQINFGKDVRGVPIDLLHPGFLRRETVVRESALTLWEEKPAYVQDVVYHVWSGRILSRPRLGGEYTWCVDGTIENDSKAVASVEASIRAAREMVEETIRFSRVTTQHCLIRYTVDPNHSQLGVSSAIAILQHNRNEIVGATLVFRSLLIARAAGSPTHELGHFLGFGHSPDPRDVMYGALVGPVFSDRLQKTWRMMTQRHAGQAYPDNDANLAGLAGFLSEEVIECSFER